MKLKKKLFLVSREVLAVSAEKAAKAKGHVYSIVQAADTPPQTSSPVGFKTKSKNGK